MSQDNTQPSSTAPATASFSLAPILHASIPITASHTYIVHEPVVISWDSWPSDFTTNSIPIGNFAQILQARGTHVYSELGSITASVAPPADINCDILLAIVGVDDPPPTSATMARRLEGTQIFTVRSQNTAILRQQISLSFPLGVSRQTHIALPPASLPALRVTFCPAGSSTTGTGVTNIDCAFELTVSGWGRLPASSSNPTSAFAASVTRAAVSKASGSK